MTRVLAVLLLAVLCGAVAHADQSGDGALVREFNQGGALAASYSCMGCHGAALKGGTVAGALYGIEHRLSDDRIKAALLKPTPPMPANQLSGDDLTALVAYVTHLDGGIDHSLPVVSWSPLTPSDRAVVSVRFPHGLPKGATAQVIMHMGRMTHGSDQVPLAPGRDPNEGTATLPFTMGGAWIVIVRYDDRELDLPLQVN